MTATQPSGSDLLSGTVAGIASWIAGFVTTYLLVAPNVRESGLARIIEALDGQPATYELVGWVFYNAHLVETVIRDIPLVGSRTTSYIGGEAGFTTLLYLVPVALLFAAGLGLARYRAVDTPAAGALIGSTVVPGYLLAVAAGGFLFEVSIGGTTGGPDLLAAVVLAGIVYPLVCAGGGGAVGGLLEARSRNQPTN
ncbi:hypothetical protein [Halohasta litorea]|uniref:DUF7978 domain-containing protein n=1 Tax=Halohasta litorea TaxID=869891 RepID=A0ABD6D4G8_9EURY|nr:hypothetical protein [Halohasta litorea]